MSANIIPFPHARRFPVPGHPPARPRVTVRAGTAAPQMALPLDGDGSAEDRREQALRTASNYERLAARADRPVTRAIYEKYARLWRERAGRLEAEIRVRAVPLDLPLEPGKTS